MPILRRSVVQFCSAPLVRFHTALDMRRMERSYWDLAIDEDEYRRKKRLLKDRLRSLVLPDADDAMTAGRLLEDLPVLWEKADLGERRRILMTMLDAVYVDTIEERRIVAIRPRPAFRPLLEIATTREGSGIHLINVKDLPAENENGPKVEMASPAHNGAVPCSWWRRGRVELPVQKKP